MKGTTAMLLWWIFGTLGSILCLGVAMFSTKKGAARLKRARNKIKRGRARATKSAWSHHVTRKAKTKRGQRKAKRKSQPYRLTGGRVRAADDPTLVRRAGRAAKSGTRTAADKVKLARVQRKDARRAKFADDPKPGLLQLGSKLIDGDSALGRARRVAHGGESMGECLAIAESTDAKCRRLETIGPDGLGTGHCDIPAHVRQVRKLQSGTAQRTAAQDQAQRSRTSTKPPSRTSAGTARMAQGRSSRSESWRVRHPQNEAQHIRNKVMNGSDPQ